MTKLMELTILAREGMKSCEYGLYGDALFKLEQARLMASNGHPLHEAKIRNNIALVYQLDGQLDVARNVFTTALNQSDTSWGRGNPLSRIIKRNLNRLEEAQAA